MSRLSLKLNLILLALVFGAAAPSFGAEESLDAQLQSLSVQSNEAPISVSQENLYSVQERFVPLSHSSEVILGAGDNVNSDSYINSRELTLGYRYHFNDRWHLTGSGSYVTNSMSGAGINLLDTQHIVPDAAYVNERANLLLGYNLFYGKFRASLDKVFYFDQYIALGVGEVWMNSGTFLGPVADIGGVFWFSRSLNAQLGVRDSYHNENRVLSRGAVNDVIVHLDLGWRLN